MTDRDPEILSEEEAARLWERAAQLQAEAAGRVEAPELHGATMPPPGYALAHVRSAALEAGIANEYVEAALADLRAGRTLPKVGKGNALARRFLNHPPNTITVRRTVQATPQDVLSAMEAVFPAEPFRLTLIDQQGDPLDGGLLVFDIQGVSGLSDQGFRFQTREAGMRQVFASLRPIVGSSSSCELTVHSPVTAHKIGLAVGSLISVVGALVGGGLGIALGVAIGIGPVGGVGGVLLGGGLSLKGFRALYGFAMRRGRKALEGLVGAVGVRAKGVWRAGS